MLCFHFKTTIYTAISTCFNGNKWDLKLTELLCNYNGGVATRPHEWDGMQIGKNNSKKHRLAAETYHESNHTSTLVVIETSVFGYKSPFLVVKNFIGIGTIISFLA
jgi:hypothetical protein